MISTIILIPWRRVAAGLPNTCRLNRGFFLAAENVAQRKCIAVPSDFHGLHRRLAARVSQSPALPFPVFP
jgi:hypothetical protein